jgi:mxaK protein
MPRRRLVDTVLILLVSASLLIFGFAAMRFWLRTADNQVIAELAAGVDKTVAETSHPNVLLARAHFLLIRDHLDEAEPLVARIAESGTPGLAAVALYDLANARLRRALELLNASKIDPAVPEVRLAKTAYRRALSHDPTFWDTKYNLDIAMRLVRDFPQIELAPEEPPPGTQRRPWTDLPGLPKGLP